MLLLTSTSDKIQVISGAAADLEVHASYADLVAAATLPTFGRTNTASITTATTTDVVGPPAASTTRNVQTLSIRNNHASIASTVLVQHTDGTTVETLIKVTLLAGELLLWSEGAWFYYEASGALKPASVFITTQSLASDQNNSTTTPTEVTGLTVALAPGIYTFEYYVVYQALLTTTGVRLSVNFDGTETLFVANVQWVDASATASTATPTQAGVQAAGHVVGAMSARAKSTAGWGTLLGVDTLSANMLARITGMLVVTVAGNLELWHGSEVAAQSTVKAGSSVIITKTG
jgi:hypothetical protein